jgi:hypothetical protein
MLTTTGERLFSVMAARHIGEVNADMDITQDIVVA